MKWLLFALPLAVGCAATQKQVDPPGNLFPEGRYSQTTRAVPCLDRAQSFLDAAGQLMANPPAPIPGDDHIVTTLELLDVARHVDVAAIEVRTHRGTNDVVYVAVSPLRDPTAPIPLELGNDPQLTVRLLLKATTHGGLFEDLTYCYEKTAYTSQSADVRGLKLVIDDDPIYAPRVSIHVEFEPEGKNEKPGDMPYGERLAQPQDSNVGEALRRQ
ncbi:MAG: hypothetical protein HOW73_16180 [Polyangiaceae bacterium]|nr:hypothetical protein [Polyangiaceae bacterium]